MYGLSDVSLGQSQPRVRSRASVELPDCSEPMSLLLICLPAALLVSGTAHLEPDHPLSFMLQGVQLPSVASPHEGSVTSPVVRAKNVSKPCQCWGQAKSLVEKIMASGPITSWQKYGETMETVTDFIFLGSKITADGDCSHEIKRRLLFGKKAMTNLTAC